MSFKTNKASIQNIFMFALFVFMFVLVVMIFKPFYSIILWSLLLYIFANPLYKKIVSRFNKEKKSYSFLCSLMSGLFSVFTILIIFVLFVFIGVRLVSQLMTFLSSAENYFIQNPDFMDQSSFAIALKAFLEKNSISTEWMQNFNLRTQILSLLNRYSSKIFAWSRVVISGTSNFLVSIIFMIFVLFFFYRDGSYLSKLFIKAMPINELYMSRLLNKFSSVINGLLSGYLLVALYQGVVAFILMKIFKVPSALLFSVVLMFVSFIPMLGAAIVWFPIGLVLCVTTSVWKGILYIVLSAVLVSGLDNFLRPFLLKDRIKVHPLVIFFGILGGIKVFGVNGLILGPIVIIMFFTLLDMLSNEDEIDVDAELEVDDTDFSVDYDEGEDGLSIKLKGLIASLKEAIAQKRKK